MVSSGKMYTAVLLLGSMFSSVFNVAAEEYTVEPNGLQAALDKVSPFAPSWYDGA